MLVQLARKFNKITRHGRAADAFISHVRQHLMQRMAELMKQRACIVI